ncbi:MAG: extracellular solute-binding protein [Mycoplasmataceae bacterium]|nr:extracellular solute-binding protein [Mycoplasmataceae bacterium]
MKKFLVLILSISLVFTLSGCYNTGKVINNTDIVVLDELPDEEINITFWHIYGQGKSAVLDALIYDFEQLYPNITVESISQGSYGDLKSKTINSISAGNTPDLVVGYPDHFAEYLNGKAIIALDGFVESEIWGVDLTDFIDSYVAENKQYADGLMYSMPYSKSTEMMVYNKTVFDHFEIELPTDRPVTWEELDVIADTIVGDGPMQCEFLINYDSASNLFINASRQWDGQYTNLAGEVLIEDANTVTMLNYVNDLFESNTLALPLEWDQPYGSANFLKGDVCMTVGSTAGIAYNVPLPGNEGKFDQFELGIAPIPQHEGGVSSVMQQGPNIAIMSDTSDAERLASWLLITFLTSTEATAQWAIDTGYLPVRYSGYDSVEFQEFLDTENYDQDYKYESMTANAAYLQVDFFQYDPAFAFTVTSSDVRDEAGLALESIYAKTRTVAQAIENMIDQLVW